MDEDTESSPANVPESPKPLAFTIDFGNNKNVDTQRQKALAEKLQKRHKRGQSLSKLEDTTSTPPLKQLPLTGNLPRKSSFQSEGYFSSDEKTDRAKSIRGGAKRNDLTLLLKHVTSDRMTQSFPAAPLARIMSPEEIELKDVSSPELDLISPFSPREQSKQLNSTVKKQQFSSPECEKMYIGEDDNRKDDNVFIDGSECEFDKSDTVSDAGTYTLDADNYSEEQKARMSIDREFKIEQVSVQKKTEEYIKSLSTMRDCVLQNAAAVVSKSNDKESDITVTKGVQALNLLGTENGGLKSPRSPTIKKFEKLVTVSPQAKTALGKVLSPIMSPTQNMSITQEVLDKTLNNGECDLHNKTFTKIMFPSPKAMHDGLEQSYDQGSIISVTSSGAFKPRIENKLERKYSLTKSEVQVQAYIDGKNFCEGMMQTVQDKEQAKKLKPKLTANIINVQSIEVKKPNISVDSTAVVSANLLFEKVSNISPTNCQNIANLPPAVGGYSGKSSPTKIPSPIHTISRPRSRNSSNVEYSDSSLDTDLILKPTQNYINSLQQRLSLDSDPDSDYDAKYGMQLNNTAHLLKQKASHTRHNSLDDRTMNISNKLEHFQNKNLQSIDQTYTNLFNQYSQNKVMHKIQNSPNNSPIRRSSSFSTKNQIHSPKNTNVIIPQKESNVCNSPSLTRNSSIQRSSSTACIKPTYVSNRRASITDHHKIDRSQFGDTESSSEEDFEKNMQKRKDLANITNTRCNRAFSLRRARIDNEPSHLKCPNTPEMRRKNFQSDIKQERAISMDRKPMKTNDVQSRYLLNISKRGTPPPSAKVEVKNVPKAVSASKTNPNRPPVFSRTDSGRFSMRTTKLPNTNNTPKGFKKDGTGKKQGGTRSNSSLSSREVEFQNWKRRKSYDPMKAAAEGKKKEIAKKQTLGVGHNAMTQSYTESNHSQDSSPSHSSSVHRSQSFHGTAALEQLLSSEEEEDLTLSADEGFSPPTPSPCELSPARASLRHTLWERIRH